MRSWYDIKNAGAAVADIYLYDEIGYFGVTAASFIEALQSVKAKAINLYVNSPGGGVDDGMAIFNALKRHPADVTATVDGLAASSASFIVQAANKIAMGSGSTMMIHEPHVGHVKDVGTDDMTKMIAALDVYGDNIAGIYASRAGGTAAQWRAKMKAETWYKAQDAVDAGLADEIVGASGGAATDLRVFNLSKFLHPPAELTQIHNRTDDDPQEGPLLPADLGAQFRKTATYTPEPTLEELFIRESAAGPVTVGGKGAS